MTSMRIDFVKQNATIFVDEYLFATLWVAGEQIETVIATTKQVEDWQKQARSEVAACFVNA